MGKQLKVKVLEVLQVQGGKQDDFLGLVFKVQLRKDSEVMTMSYDQLKYCYPQALIDYYESRSDFFDQTEEPEQFEEAESQLFDYDQHFYFNGSKILEYVNSLTYCLPVKQKGKKQPPQFENVKVFEKQTQKFYKNFILEKDSKSTTFLDIKKIEDNNIELQ